MPPPYVVYAPQAFYLDFTHVWPYYPEIMKATLVNRLLLGPQDYAVLGWKRTAAL